MTGPLEPAPDGPNAEARFAEPGRDAAPPDIERVDVALRAGTTLLFLIGLALLRNLGNLLILFQLGYSAVTRQQPPRGCRELGAKIAAYIHRVLRYMLHAESERPFPFADWPAEEPVVADAYEGERRPAV